MNALANSLAAEPLSPADAATPITSEATIEGAVMDALSDERYLWRTAEGIARDTGFSTRLVKSVLIHSSDSVIRSVMDDEQGRPLYTTPQHYRAHAGILRRALSALCDQVR